MANGPSVRPEILKRKAAARGLFYARRTRVRKAMPFIPNEKGVHYVEGERIERGQSADRA